MIDRVRPLVAWIWLTGAILVIALLQAAVPGSAAAPPALTHNSATPNGALAAFLWLGKVGYHVRTGNLPLTYSRVTDASSESLLIMQHGADIDPARGARLLSWVEAGGRLIIGIDGSTATSLLRLLRVSLVPIATADVQVTQPLLAAPPVVKVSGGASYGIDVPGGAPAVKGDGVPVVMHVHRGHGQIWIISTPRMMSNQLIARDDNRRLLLNLVGPPNRTVTFDESSAVSIPTAASQGWLSRTQWGAMALFLAGITVVYRWLSGWRLGPALVPIGDGQPPLTEYVESLACLLRRAQRREDTLRIYQRSLERHLQEKWGTSDWRQMKPDQQQTIETLLSPQPNLSEAELVGRASEIVKLGRDVEEEHWTARRKN